MMKWKMSEEMECFIMNNKNHPKFLFPADPAPIDRVSSTEDGTASLEPGHCEKEGLSPLLFQRKGWGMI